MSEISEASGTQFGLGGLAHVASPFDWTKRRGRVLKDWWPPDDRGARGMPSWLDRSLQASL
jgi:hypothetical protein